MHKHGISNSVRDLRSVDSIHEEQETSSRKSLEKSAHRSINRHRDGYVTDSSMDRRVPKAFKERVPTKSPILMEGHYRTVSPMNQRMSHDELKTLTAGLIKKLVMLNDSKRVTKEANKQHRKHLLKLISSTNSFDKFRETVKIYT